MWAGRDLHRSLAQPHYGQKGDSANTALMMPVGHIIATKAWKMLIITETVRFETHWQT